jgi:hypothetical protein
MSLGLASPMFMATTPLAEITRVKMVMQLIKQTHRKPVIQKIINTKVG